MTKINQGSKKEHMDDYSIQLLQELNRERFGGKAYVEKTIYGGRLSLGTESLRVDISNTYDWGATVTVEGNLKIARFGATPSSALDTLTKDIEEDISFLKSVIHLLERTT